MNCSPYRSANGAMRMGVSNSAMPMPADAPAVPGLGDPAPDFTAMTTQGVKSLSDYRGKWLIFFSHPGHPGDFTPVCTTEFLALMTQRYQDFVDRSGTPTCWDCRSTPTHRILPG